MGKDDSSKTREYWEEVIQEIKGLDEVGRKDRRDDLG